MSENDTNKPEESEEEVKADEAEAPEELKLEAEVEEAPAAKEEEAQKPAAEVVKAEEPAAEVKEAEEPATEVVEAEESKEEPAAVAVKAAESKEEPAAEAVKAEETKEAPAPEASPATSAVLKKAEEKLKEFEKDEEEELMEKVVFINRCAKVVKGGRRFSFSALVVCGDQNGNVGYGFGKANEVADCIRKGSEMSKKAMVPVALKDNTIPHEVIGEYGGGRVMLRPASPGTGIIAGGGVRAVVEAAGIKDVLAKSMGSNNHANVVKATLKALTSLRTREQIYKLRGKKMKEKAAL